MRSREPFDATVPPFFLPARAWRCYAGGELLERFLGHDEARDGHYPEAWIASTTRACNGPDHPGTEGLSRLRQPDGAPGPLLADLLQEYSRDWLGARATSDTLPVLCKFLDSAIRLPIQCHPDRAFARAHYGSDYGKSECWIVLDTRRIDDVEPYLLLGFKPGVTRESFVDAIRRQDVTAMEACLHKVPVRAGDAWYIPGRFPHAIGPGVFMLEVQEPSDWVVQPERFCGSTQLPEAARYGPLHEDLALDCFAYEGRELEAIRRDLFMTPRTIRREDGGRLDALADGRYGDCFTVQRLRVTGALDLPPGEWRLAIVTGGSGRLRMNATDSPLRPGDACLLPHERGATFIADHPAQPLETYLVHG